MLESFAANRRADVFVKRCSGVKQATRRLQTLHRVAFRQWLDNVDSSLPWALGDNRGLRFFQYDESAQVVSVQCML